jgi:Concanavalin A-like lectin/glucanases superfamily
LDDGAWHHLAVTCDRNNILALFQDGVPTDYPNTTLVGSISSGLPLNIGQDGTGHYSASGIANARLDDLGLWLRPLTPTEVEFIYLQGRDGLSFDSP